MLCCVVVLKERREGKEEMEDVETRDEYEAHSEEEEEENDFTASVVLETPETEETEDPFQPAKSVVQDQTPPDEGTSLEPPQAKRQKLLEDDQPEKAPKTPRPRFTPCPHYKRVEGTSFTVDAFRHQSPEISCYFLRSLPLFHFHPLFVSFELTILFKQSLSCRSLHGPHKDLLVWPCL